MMYGRYIDSVALQTSIKRFALWPYLQGPALAVEVPGSGSASQSKTLTERSGAIPGMAYRPFEPGA